MQMSCEIFWLSIMGSDSLSAHSRVNTTAFLVSSIICSGPGCEHTVRSGLVVNSTMASGAGLEE